MERTPTPVSVGGGDAAGGDAGPRDGATVTLGSVASVDAVDSRQQPRPAFLPGEIVAERFRVVGFLGQGGMGQVFEAFDRALGVAVAVKVIRPDLAAQPAAVERFRREVLLARQVTHANVCRIFEVFEHRGDGPDHTDAVPLVLLSMELLRGETLSRRLTRGGPIPVAEALPLARQLADALAAAHRAGVVHRDFKPGNVLLVEGPDGPRAVVTDFGVAVLAVGGAGGQGRRDGAPAGGGGGTPAYMAPEELLGHSSPQGDLYSLAVVVVEMLAGSRPSCHPVRGCSLPPGLAPSLDIEDVLLRCLEPRPEDRPASAAVLAAAVDRAFAAPSAGVEVLVRVRAPRDGEPVLPRSLLARTLGSFAGSHRPVDGNPAESDFSFSFGRVADALSFVLALGRTAAPGVGLHLGELAAPGSASSSPKVLAALAELALPGQILLSRSAFELARQMLDDGARREAGEAVAEAGDLRWLAHGPWAVTGLDAPIEVFEVGRAERSPLIAPADRPTVRSVPAPGAVLGWRPAAGARVPERPHWRIVRKLGEGGFGDVWLTAHAKTGERRVLKFCYDVVRLAALRREVTLFRLLREELGDRDDISRILDWNLDREPYFVEAEYTAHGDLCEWLQAQGGVDQVPLATRIELVARVADALAAAHSVGILHRDVKPTNVLVGGDREGVPRIRLTDFGIGQALDRGRLEAAGITLLGVTAEAATGAGPGLTRLYASPELLEGRSPTVQADVYALGVMLYQLVAGDLGRALSAGWERAVSDPLLAEDIALAVDGSPARRPSAGRLAERLRSLAARGSERRAAERFRDEAAATRKALQRARERRRFGLTVVALALAFATGMAVLARRLAQEATLARDLARVALASEWMSKDPTRAALVLLEVERPRDTPRAVGLARQALGQPLAGRELRGHAGPLAGVVFSPDGRWVVTAGLRDGTVRVWPFAGEGPARVLSGGAGPASEAANLDLSPRGDRVASAHWDGVARVWTLGSSAPPILLRGHRARLWHARFSPDGSRLVTCSDDGTARVWNADGSGAPIVLAGHAGWVFWAAFTPDGHQVVTAGQDGRVRVWDATGKGLLATMGVPGDWLFAAEPDPSGERIATASRDGTIRLWSADGTGPPVVLGAHAASVYGVRFSGDGRLVATAANDGTVRVWRADGSGAQLALDGPSGASRVVLSRDGVWVAAGFSDGSLRLATADGRRAVATLRGHDERIRHLQFSPDGRWLASASEDGTVRIWPTGGEVVQVLAGHSGPISSVVALADGKRLLSGSTDGTARLWTLDGTRPPVVLGLHSGHVTAVAASSDGRWLATGSLDDTIRLWSATGEPIALLEEHDDTLIGLTFLADPPALLALSFDGTLSLRSLEASSGRPGEALRVRRGTGYAGHVSFGRGGRALVATGADGIVRLWSARGTPLAASAGSALVVAEQPRALVAALAPDGRYLLTGREDGSVAVRRLDPRGRGAPVLTRIFGEHARRVRSIAFAADGRRVVTASADGSARVWHVTSEEEASALFGHEGEVTAAAFTADDQRVVTGGADGTLRVWPLSTVEPWAALAAATSICLDPGFRTRSLGESLATARARFERCESARRERTVR